MDRFARETFLFCPKQNKIPRWRKTVKKLVRIAHSPIRYGRSWTVSVKLLTSWRHEHKTNNLLNLHSIAMNRNLDWFTFDTQCVQINYFNMTYSPVGQNVDVSLAERFQRSRDRAVGCTRKLLHVPPPLLNLQTDKGADPILHFSWFFQDKETWKNHRDDSIRWVSISWQTFAKLRPSFFNVLWCDSHSYHQRKSLSQLCNFAVLILSFSMIMREALKMGCSLLISRAFLPKTTTTTTDKLTNNPLKPPSW